MKKLIFLCLFFLPALSHAQDKEGFKLDGLMPHIGYGSAVMYGNNPSDPSTSISYYLDHIALGLDLRSNKGTDIAFNAASCGEAFTGSPYLMHMTTYGLNLNQRFYTQSWCQPFIGIGLRFVNYEFDTYPGEQAYTIVNGVWVPNTIEPYKASKGPYFNGNLGFYFHAKSHLYFIAEMEAIFNRTADAPFTMTNVLMFRGSIGYNFKI